MADALSRLIHNSQEAVPFDNDNDNHFLYSLEAGCMDLSWHQIETYCENDDEVQSVKKAIENNAWIPSLSKFEAHKTELRVLGSLIFKDNKVILPRDLRLQALALAHEGHVGELAMKRIMRNFFWWPAMSTTVERYVKNCETCARLSKRNPPVPLCSRELPEGPWEIIQIDFLTIPDCGSGEFLVVVDTYSRYLSVVEMRCMDADSTNTALCSIFKLWGLPKIIQSDNGPPFQGSRFVSTWEDKGVRVRKAVPLSPQSNGSVERQNQGILKAVSGAKIDKVNWRIAIQKYVHHHNTLVPHSRLNVTPFELLVGWKFRGTFPSLWKSGSLDRTDIREKDAEAKWCSKQYADRARHAKDSDIVTGDWVLLAQHKKTKTDPTFSAEKFRVIAIDGPKVTVLSDNGIQYSRNIQEVKRVSFNDENSSPSPATATRLDDTCYMNQADQDEFSLQPSLTREIEPPSFDEKITENEEADPGRRLRPRTVLRKPCRFNDKFIYRIIH